MLIVSNRNLDPNFEQSGVGNHKAFGEQINAKGPIEIRLATASFKSGKWKVELCPEPANPRPRHLPSKKQFDVILKRCKTNDKNCLFFVHGYNKPFKATLEQGWRLQERYGLEVIVFSWPSNTGGIPLTEYRDVKRVARVSTGALDSAFEKLATYLSGPFNRKALDTCGVKLSLMTYSMGNFLFQSYVEGAHYDAETRMFDNVVLCQADCDNENHESWVEEVEAGKRVYITINENDKILKWSDLNFQKDRLGRTVRDLYADNSIYVDFTDGPDVDDTHQLWGNNTNDTAREFFQRVLNGVRGEDVQGLTYDARVNAFRNR